MNRLNDFGNQLMGGERAVLYAGAGIFFPAFWVIDSLVCALDRLGLKRFAALARYCAIAFQIAFVLLLHPNVEWWAVSIFAFASGFHPIAAVVIPILFERNERLAAFAFATSTLVWKPIERLPKFIARFAAVAHILAFLGNQSNDYVGDLKNHATFTLQSLSFRKIDGVFGSS